MENYSVLPKGAKILIICDAIDENLQAPRPRFGAPLTNGVCNLVRNTIKELQSDYEFFIIHPYMKKNDQYIFIRFPFPRYPQLEFALPNPIRIWQFIKDFRPDAIIIATVELTLGRTAKLLCHYPGSRLTKDGSKIPYTLLYTTNIDQYLSLYFNHHTNGLLKISPPMFNPVFKRFYAGANKVLTPTLKIQEKLHQMGIYNTNLLPRGVDTKIFRPIQKNDVNPYCQYVWYKENPLPIFLYFGRVSLVKGIEDFLSLKTPQAHKVVIGEGPYLKTLQKIFRNSPLHFLGAFYNESLANYIRFADLVFFPSKTDTWAQTITEAGASGVPVIAYDVPGSGEVIVPGVTGILISPDKSLDTGINDGMRIDRKNCAQKVNKLYSWEKTARILVENVKPIQWK